MLSPGFGATALYNSVLRRLELSDSIPIYADVAMDIPARELEQQLFTYRVPDHLTDEVCVGTQVLVPFGHQEMVSGYVIALKDKFSHNGSFGGKLEQAGRKIQIKSIVEVLESEPLFDPAYISFLNWVAEYYCSSITEVIAAAIPADVGPKVKRVVRLVHPSEADENEVAQLRSAQWRAKALMPPEQARLLDELGRAGKQTLAVRALKQRSGLSQAKFYASLTKLRQEGRVVVERENATTMAPKTVATVVWTGEVPSTPRQEQVLGFIRRSGGQMSVPALVEAANTTSDTIKRMCKQGILTLHQEEIIRDPLKHLGGNGNGKNIPELTTDQQTVVNTLSSALLSALDAPAERSPQTVEAAESANDVFSYTPWLLHGVTGSGKTEVYMRLIDIALKKQRSVLMMVPEISLTPQLAQRLVDRFGKQVAVWHSALSAGERYDTWRRLKAGDTKILLGARSAILANLPDLGLIILDEEHDGSYKQSSPSPRYHARTLAEERAKRTGSLLLLGSATPDVVSYQQAQNTNRILELPERVFKQALPASVLIDMRLEQAARNRSIFSRSLLESLAVCLKQKEQAILLINRRGYASHVFCRSCGFVMRCNNCSVSLVFHQTGPNAGHLICHHCAFQSDCTEICPACESPFIRQFGLGTQRVEEELRENFPDAKVLRLDSDITSRKGAYEEVFNQFSAGEADVLIGTQIVAKGLDIAKVTLVGVLAADAAFNLPDYRSFERGFQLLTQVSGRAGRGAHAGKVILQTYNVALPALLMAKKQDYKTFFAEEIESRKEYQYPPYSQIIRVVAACENSELAQSATEQLAEELSNYLEDKVEAEAVKILGPAPCLIERLRGKYRFHIIIKNLAGSEGRRLVTHFLRHHRGHSGLSIAVDIEAVDLI